MKILAGSALALLAVFVSSPTPANAAPTKIESGRLFTVVQPRDDQLMRGGRLAAGTQPHPLRRPPREARSQGLRDGRLHQGPPRPQADSPVPRRIPAAQRPAGDDHPGAAAIRHFNVEPRRVGLAAGKGRRFPIKLKHNRASLRKIKALLKAAPRKARRRARVVLRVVAVDRGGQRVKARRKVRLK